MNVKMKSSTQQTLAVFLAEAISAEEERRRKVVLKIQMQFTPVGIETDNRNEKLWGEEVRGRL